MYNLTDKELITIAARADNIKGHFGLGGITDHFWVEDQYGESTGTKWGPLEDDGQLLRLANSQQISIIFSSCTDDAPIVTAKYFGGEITNCNYPDPYKATRRTVVQAVVAQQLQLEEAINGL